MNIREEWNKCKDGWVGTVVYLLVGFLIAYGFNLAMGLVLRTDTPVVAVFSDSMDPIFYKGDMVIVQGVPTYNRGDIVVFNVPDRNYPIIHRIIDINGSKIRTKGDNNQVIDPWVTDISSIHGKEILIIPALGWVKIFFTELTGLG